MTLPHRSRALLCVALGAMLSARGLLTPNMYTGGQQFHSVLEWASVQDMAKSAATIVELVKLWAEPEWAARATASTTA